MTFQIFIFIVMSSLMIHGWRQKQRAPAIGFAMVLTSAVGVLLAAAPELLQLAAGHLGIGRGVDLMFYLFIVVTVLLIANIHLRIRETKDSMTELVRHLAISSAKKHPPAQN